MMIPGIKLEVASTASLTSKEAQPAPCGVAELRRALRGGGNGGGVTAARKSTCYSVKAGCSLALNVVHLPGKGVCPRTTGQPDAEMSGRRRVNDVSDPGPCVLPREDTRPGAAPGVARREDVQLGPGSILFPRENVHPEVGPGVAPREDVGLNRAPYVRSRENGRHQVTTGVLSRIGTHRACHGSRGSGEKSRKKPRAP